MDVACYWWISWSVTKHVSWKTPALNYTLEACETDSAEICPEAGDIEHCPCVSAGSTTQCDKLECSDVDRDPSETCATFVFSTVSAENT